MKARNLCIGLMLLMGLAMALPVDAAGTAPTILAMSALDQPDIDVNISDGDDDWYKNPLIIGIGVVLLVLLIALVTRGGGTTVVKS